MLNEYQDNHFIKEQDKVEKYLIRIIQRYFDIENNFTKESIEAMIIESLTRFKQMIISETGFIFSLNKQTGNLTLTIRDFGGEPAIIKKTAFNKNFGDADDTICEGNDPRLSDDREPIEHVHQLSDINGLKEKLDELNITGVLHTHNNKSVLDLLQYTGAQAQFDLIIVEHLQKVVNEYISNLQSYNKELTNTHNKYIEKLTLYLLQINQTLSDIYFTISSAEAWLQEAYKYTDSKAELLKQKLLQTLSKYLTKEQANKLLSLLSRSYNVISDGEIPLTDGEISFTPIQEGVKEFTIGGGGTINENFDTLSQKWVNESTKLGNGTNLWTYDDEFTSVNNKSYDNILRFGGGDLGDNEIELYPMIVSHNKYKNYTHRVTLKSAAIANDCISVVLAYDETTGNHLSLMIGMGGANDSGTTKNNATARLIYNFKDYKLSNGVYEIIGTPIGDEILIKEQTGLISPGWNDLENGITVLTKKENNNIKVWVLFDETHSWTPNANNDIVLTDAPMFEFSLNDYPELSCFIDKKCNYGYGNYSQPISIYDDMYFFSPDETGSGEITIAEPYGHTNICESSKIEYDIPDSVLSGVNNPNVKFYFRYGEDDKEIAIPLPVSLKDNNGNHAIVQASYTKDGHIIINTKFLNKINIYAPDNSQYENSLVVPTFAVPGTVKEILDFLEKEKCELSLINSGDKNNFVKNLLLPNREYYIQGKYFKPEGEEFYDNDMNPLQYTDWDSGEPVKVNDSHFIKYNTNKKWATADGLTEGIGFVAEYKLRKMTQFFTNPRVYYQVLGNKEVI